MKTNGIVTLISAFWLWLLETSAFVLLPLIVYLIVFSSVNLEKADIFKLPEWMFVSIILFGESLRKSLIYYKDAKGFHIQVLHELSITILGIVISSVFLIFSIISHYNESFPLSPSYYGFQMTIFGFSVFYSFITTASSYWKKGDANYLFFGNPEQSSTNKPNDE
jgi:hypothetical protein